MSEEGEFFHIQGLGEIDFKLFQSTLLHNLFIYKHLVKAVINYLRSQKYTKSKELLSD